MDKENSNKIITLCFLIFAAIVAFVCETLLASLSGNVGMISALNAYNSFKHGVPVGIGIITFFAMRLNRGVMAWAEEVVLETMKVVWPSKKDTWAMTIVVCVMVLVAGVVFGLFDTFAHNLIGWFVG